jgi:Zn-dependent protease
VGLAGKHSSPFRRRSDTKTRGYDEFVSQLTPQERAELTPEERAALEYYSYGEPQPIRHEPRFPLLRKLAAPFIALGLLLAKFKFILLAVFKLKLFTTSATMLVSVGAYALLWGWKFAIGFVALLFIHEMGHVLEARRQGLPVSAPMFIPFLGALITLKQLPHDAWKEAQVALAGPVVGSIGAAAFWAYGEATNSELFIALGFVGFLLNLFNLLPVPPLDGGRAVGAIHPLFWLAGLAGLVGLTILAPNPILLIVLVFGGMELWSRWQLRSHPEQQDYYRVAPWQRAVVGVVYIGLAAALGLGISASHIEKDI